MKYSVAVMVSVFVVYLAFAQKVMAKVLGVMKSS